MIHPTLSPSDYEAHARTLGMVFKLLLDSDHTRLPVANRRKVESGIIGLRNLADDLNLAGALLRGQIQEERRALIAEKRDDRRREDREDHAALMGGRA